MFQELFPILTTGDLPRALGFYRDLLGFQVTWQFPPEGQALPRLSRLPGGLASAAGVADNRGHGSAGQPPGAGAGRARRGR
jgi:hypothetical protein